ncbi:MAG: DUF397 domain-containing protein [Nocardia sp.]|nr:DUF397 domain-containing protein [Nocardia sp.]
MKPELAGARWFKSSHSSAGSECVEVAFLEGAKVGVRDSKNVNFPALVFTPDQWDAFIADVAGGKLGH